MALNTEQLERLRSRFPAVVLAGSCTVVDSYFDGGAFLGTGASVMGSRIGEGVRLEAGASVTGARVGAGAVIGAGAKVEKGVTVGNGIVIAAGRAVAADVGVYTAGADADNGLELEEFLLEKLPLVHVWKWWVKARGDETLRLDYPLGAGSRVLDVGGFEGDFAAAIVGRYGCHVDVFEPMPAFVEGMRRRFIGEGRVRVHGYGLGGRTRREELTVASESSSMVRGNAGERVGIEVRAAAEFLGTFSGAVDLLKINIEGAEYELLEHLLDEGLMERVRFLQVQFHDFVDGAREKRRRLRERLRGTHVAGWGFAFIWESWMRKCGMRNEE